MKQSARITKAKSNRKSSNSGKIILTLFFIVMLLTGFRYLSTASANSPDTLTLAENKAAAADNIPGQSSVELSTDDLSYILMDPSSEQILKAYNADLQRAPASTLKLLTGLVAINNLKETDIVKVGTEVNVEGSRLGLQPGDEISVKNLLTALYVNSSNDAAAALAVKAAGSVPEFARKMNEYAVSIGCNNSNFTTPHGLPDSNQYTTANDLSKIAAKFLSNKVLINYTKQTSAHVQWKNAQGLYQEANIQNTNRLLDIYPGDQGLKTGTTTEAGQCLISYVTRPDGDMLLVLLGSQQRYRDTIKLLDEAWAEQRTESALKGLAKDPRALILSPGIF